VKFLGYKLKNLRDVLGLSMTDLKKLSGIDQGYISEIENGKKQPSDNTVQKLCKATGIDELYFYIDGPNLSEVTPDIMDDLKTFVSQGKNLPWLLFSMKQAKRGISLKTLDTISDALESETEKDD